MLQPCSDTSADPRAGGRANVFLTAVLEAGGTSARVRVRNLSTRGALLDGTDLPTEGTVVRLRRGQLQVQGEVAWDERELRGVRFDAEIDVADWVKRVEHIGQQKVDEAVAQIRSSGISADERQAPPSGRAVLEQIRDDLGHSCERLSLTRELTVEVAEEVLRLDAITQRLSFWIANAVAPNTVTEKGLGARLKLAGIADAEL